MLVAQRGQVLDGEVGLVLRQVGERLGHRGLLRHARGVGIVLGHGGRGRGVAEGVRAAAQRDLHARRLLVGLHRAGGGRDRLLHEGQGLRRASRPPQAKDRRAAAGRE